MSTLEKIMAYKREEVAAAKRACPLAALEAAARAATPPRGFLAALRKARSARRYGLIAEIKRASPSRGLIRADFDVADLARQYTEGGATCLSVLTDGPSFQGDLSYLALARAATPLPALRKDFLFDPYQVAEARAAEADCILIILAAVSDAQARALIGAAKDYRLDWLVEVHNAAELDRALALDAPMIGINNRDLNTFITSPGVTRSLAPRIPADRLVVSESGLGTPEDLASLAAMGVTTFLIGESLMRQRDVAAATRALLVQKAHAR